MLARYGVDVLDPRVSLRRVWVLARRIPPGTWPDVESPLNWTVESYLLAEVVDAVAALTYVTIKAYGGKPKQPKPFPRPGAAQKRKGVKMSWSGLARQLAGQTGIEVG